MPPGARQRKRSATARQHRGGHIEDGANDGEGSSTVCARGGTGKMFVPGLRTRRRIGGSAI
jgi:hypothetical protein